MVTDLRTRLAAWSSTIGVALTAISCTVMIAATIIGLLGVIGIRSSAEFADTFNHILSPIAQPLLIISLALVVIGLIPHGRVAVALALLGGGLVYLSMFVLGASSSAAADMAGMTGMNTTAADPVSLAVFWIGIAGIGFALVIAYRK
ncbi:MAG TPA: hypothetical protein VFD70_19805 [Anaerolineae bacterium]|nr:hypothetical protein [Anaerolineae bacterium]